MFMRRSFVRHLAPSLMLVAAACGPAATGGGDDDDDQPAIDAGFDNDSNTPPVTEECRKMDLIFVIDDSGSMQEEQTNLASNFPMFASLLNSYTISTGETLDYRAAITTTGITANITIQPPMVPGFPPFPPIQQPQTGLDGKFKQSCGMTRPWLERTDPNMATTFACNANVGTGGPAIEMPLRASQLAATLATNPGFLREDALLGIVILTDEDDCSRTSTTFTTAGDNCATNGDTGLEMPSEIIATLDQVKGERGRWAAAIIAGQTSCSSSFGMAEEGIRLKQFQQAAGTNVIYGDICAGNLAPALQQALESFQAACENFPPIGRQAPPPASTTATSSASSALN
ncbi:MAG: hypothetical protein JNK64_25985 [Myxococcales bacterium]|nr:hypothetical protein [Myxococcales bacterium]